MTAMLNFFVFAYIGIFSVVTMGQQIPFPDGFPDCGKDCITNMVAKASEFNCGATDVHCMCSNENFTFGIRDCSVEHCQNQTAANEIITYGLDICSKAGVSVPVTTQNAPSPTSTDTATITAGSSVPVTTSAVVSIFTTDGTAVTSTVGSTTLYSVVGGVASGSAPPASLSSFTTVVVSGGSTITSTGVSTILATETPSATTAAPSGAPTTTGGVASSGTTGPATSSRHSSSTSSGFGAQKTVAPAGLLAAAGMAVFLL